MNFTDGEFDQIGFPSYSEIAGNVVSTPIVLFSVQ